MKVKVFATKEQHVEKSYKEICGDVKNKNNAHPDRHELNNS